MVIDITPEERDILLAKLRHSVNSIKGHARERELQGRELDLPLAKRLVAYSLLIAKLEGTWK